MKISFRSLLSMQTGAVVKAIGQTGITYYAMVDRSEGFHFIVGCPEKSYCNRRLYPEQVGWVVVDMPDNEKEKSLYLKYIRGIDG